jgi:hypothetical protein
MAKTASPSGVATNTRGLWLNPCLPRQVAGGEHHARHQRSEHVRARGITNQGSDDSKIGSMLDDPNLP